MLVKTRYKLIMLTVAFTCAITSAVSMATSLTPYASATDSKASNTGSQRCLGVTQQALVEDFASLNRQRPHDRSSHAELCVERYDAGGETNQLESVSILLLHSAIYRPLSGFAYRPGLDCDVKSLGAMESLSGEGLVSLAASALPAKDDQSTALWSPSGGGVVFDFNGEDPLKSLRDEPRFVQVSAPVASMPYTPDYTMWDFVLYFGPFILMIFERLRGRI